MEKNAISWFEIPVADFNRAKNFYGTILGTELHQEQMGPITMGFLPHDRESGGVGGAICYSKDYTPSEIGTLAYLNGGKDLSVILNKVESAGGKIICPKTEIAPGMGFIGLFMDPEGNRVGLYSAG